MVSSSKGPQHRPLHFNVTPSFAPPPSSPGSSAQYIAAASPGWRMLPTLPDPVGFGGMFAGTCGSELLAGGGSQFRDKPIWQGGAKTFSDRIFSLTTGALGWLQLPERLPQPAANFACAWSEDAIFLVGGLTAEGSTARSWRIQRRGGRLDIDALPDLPHSRMQACAAVVGDRLYVAGGLRAPTDTTALTEVWSLQIRSGDHWRAEPSLPGGGVFVATAASGGSMLYVLGGMEFDSAGKFAPSQKAYCFNTIEGAWRMLPQMPAARVGPASPSVVLPSGKILVVGGYTEIFSGSMREHPGFPSETFLYDIAQEGWTPGPVLPQSSVVDRDRPTDPGPCPTVLGGSAIWNDVFVVVSGESRAATRTPSVIGWPLSADPQVTPQ